MTDWLPPDDIRAAAEAYAELDPSYRQAVVESFLEMSAGISTRAPKPGWPTPPRRRYHRDTASSQGHWCSPSPRWPSASLSA